MTLFEAIVLHRLENIDHRTAIIERILRNNNPHDDPEILALTNKLRAGTVALNEALTNANAIPLSPATMKGFTVNPILQNLADAVTQATSAEASAITLINGIAQRIQDAVNAALAGGATAAQLAPVQAEADALKASAQSLTDAIAANTPAAPAFKKK